MPVREVSNRGGNVIGYFPSIKMKRKMAFESTIERDKMTLVDFDPDVQAFEEQPLVIPYQYNNKTVTYTPDILVQTLEKCILVECKPATLVDTEDNLRKFHEARKWCEQHNFEFEVVTDEQVREGYRLSNVKRLTQYARHVIAPQVKSRIYSVLRTIGKPIPITTCQCRFDSVHSCRKKVTHPFTRLDELLPVGRRMSREQAGPSCDNCFR